MGVAGIILAGGLGSRMEGRDKALLTLDGETLVARAARSLAPQVTTLALNANGDPERFGELACPVIRDDGEAGGGPLAGVLAGLRWANGFDLDCEALATVAVDTPFFPADLVQRLAGARTGLEGIAVAASSGRRHPTFALWPLAIVDDLARHLSSGASRKMTDFIDAHPNVTVDFALADRHDPFFNINTPADLDAARGRLRS